MELVTDLTDPQPTADPALLAEADAAIVDAPPDTLTEDGQPAAPAPDPVAVTEEYRKALHFPVMAITEGLLPQWKITPELREEWVSSSSECLAQLFPDGINGKYACWFRLLFCTGVIVVNGVAQNGGKIPGIGPKRETPAVIEHGTAQQA